MATGMQCNFNATSLGVDTPLGAALGWLVGPEINGITAGRGSYSSVFIQMVTKQAYGTIDNVSASTAATMATYLQAVGLTGTSTAPIVSALENAVPSGTSCGWL
jgi:hypothetical protein